MGSKPSTISVHSGSKSLPKKVSNEKDEKKSKDQINTEKKQCESTLNVRKELHESRPSSAHSTSSFNPDLPKDVMISYSHQDKVMMTKLRECLEHHGITVWVDVVGLTAGVDFLDKIGRAILNAKMFISLLSKSSLESKYCRDEVALAYISQKPIFPVALQKQQDLYNHMGTSTRLQLGGLEWTYLLDEATFEQDCKSLIEKMQYEIKEQEKETENKENWRKNKLFRQKSIVGMEEQEHPSMFWKKHFGNEDFIAFDTFFDIVLKEYKSLLAQLCGCEENEDWLDWLRKNLKRELFAEDDDIVSCIKVVEFCTDTDEVVSLWQSIENFVREMYAIETVFSMNSHVRVDAIENLGKFKSPKVIESLRDLLDNNSANIRAVAAISLVKSGDKSHLTIKRLLKSLNDKDRLVREAGCLSLGNLKATEAVPALLRLWRNDFISHVREAAKLALEQIGGDEVTEAMHITTVLAKEIRILTEE